MYEKACTSRERRTISMAEARKIPGTFGDPIRVIQNLPGAARAPFSTGLLIIRGANPEDSGVYVDGIDRTPDASGITAPRIVGGVVPAAWQPDVTRRDGTAGHVDFRAAGDVLSSTEGVQNWRIEVRGPTQKVKHDRVLIEVGGTLEEEDQADLVRRFVAAAGASIHAINVVADPHVLETRIAELGTPFLDAR